MSENRVEERRAAGSDRRVLEMDRRQFVDMSWSRDKERRLAGDERRLDEGDRRS